MGKRILYIIASPRENAHSTQAADVFVENYLAAHPGDQVERLELWKAKLPAFDGNKVAAKYATAFGQVPDENSGWDEVVKITEHFKSFDAYVLAVPMWNFGVNYIFKHYIDVIVQPGLTFNYTASGLVGLVSGKPVVVVSAKGGVYPEKSPIDFHTPYLDWILRFIGFTQISYIHVEGQSDPTHALAKREEAIEAARTLAQKWGQ